MRNIFRFFIKHILFVLFLLLETISVLLVVNTDDYNSFITGSSIANITGSVFNTTNKIKNYFRLKSINNDLMEENAMLRSKLMSAYRDDIEKNNDTIPEFILTLKDSDSILVKDSLCFIPAHLIVKESYQVYDFTGATIIQNTVNKRNNYILINKGKLDGITPNMGVVSSKSIVGVVMQTTNHYSSVLPLLHSKSRVSAKLSNDNEYGIVEWDGRDYRYASMREIPYHANINIGDTIITSGRSNIYPSDIPIGLVKELSVNEGDGFYLIKVELFEDYRKLDNVYIIKNQYKPELDSLNIMFN